MKLLKLNDAYKQFIKDQDKVMSPLDTIKSFKDKLKTLNLDILKETKRIDQGRLGIPVYFSVCGADAKKLTGQNKQMGKGATPEQAEASAIMELAERYSFFSFSQRMLIYKSYNEMKNDIKSDFKDKLLDFKYIAQSVHDTSDDLEKVREILFDLPMRWTPASNLTKQEPVLIPFDWFYMINEFNGSCAGNCPEEALVQGISEVVERHVCSIVSNRKQKVSLIDLDTVVDPVVIDMIRKYKNIGVKLVASDFSLDTKIPTVSVLAYDPSTFPQSSEIVWTAGTTPDPQKSLSRALTEVAQLAGDFNTNSNYLASGLPKLKSLDQADFLINAGNPISIFDLPNLSNANMKIEIDNYLSMLSQKSTDVFCVDITDSKLQVPAFYTIIPGAHFRERAKNSSVGLFTAKLISEKCDPETAMKKLIQMDNKLSNKYYIKFYLGFVCLAQNLYDNAFPFFKQALEQNPSSEDIPSIYLYLAICSKEKEDYKTAISLLEQAIVYDKDRTDTYNLKGFCHFKLKQHELAIGCFENVLRINPSSAIDYANIASNYRDMGQKAEAIEYYKQALRLDPTIEFAKDNLKKLIN